VFSSHTLVLASFGRRRGFAHRFAARENRDRVVRERIDDADAVASYPTYTVQM